MKADKDLCLHEAASDLTAGTASECSECQREMVKVSVGALLCALGSARLVLTVVAFTLLPDPRCCLMNLNFT